MSWIFFALLAPLFEACSNYIDKYSLDRYMKGIFDFMMFSTIISWLFLIGLVYYFGVPTWSSTALIPIGLGMAMIYSYGFYGKALEKGETSQLIILFQGVPILTLLLGIILFGQHLNLSQWLASGLVLLGGACITIERVGKVFSFINGLRWIILAVVIEALIFLIADVTLERIPFWDFVIYDTIGSACAGIPLLLFTKSRAQIALGFRTATVWKYAWFVGNNVLDFLAQLSMKKALALAPSAGIVTVVTQVQSVYVIILGIVLTLILPNRIKENISRNNIMKKIIGACIMFAGIVVLVLYS